MNEHRSTCYFFQSRTRELEQGLLYGFAPWIYRCQRASFFVHVPCVHIGFILTKRIEDAHIGVSLILQLTSY